MAPSKRNNVVSGSAGSVPVTAARVKQMILARKEKKVCSSASSSTSTTSGVVTYLVPIALGDDADDRTGNVIRPVSMVSRLSVDSAATTTTRFILLQDVQANGTSPTTTDVLISASPFTSYEPINLAMSRFKVLYDVNLNTSASGTNIVTRTINFKMKGTIHFSGTASTSGSAGRNGIFLLVISDVATVYQTHHQMIYTDA